MDTIDNRPLVAIHCFVYNHEPYLRDCFEGFVMQQTNFPFVAIVHDDASTDGSAAIIREYEARYPHIFKPIYETENQYSKRDGSIDRIINKAIDATCAKYVAMCEGDDYWIDPLKLQKQVDFMEANNDYVLCCHRYKIYNQYDGTWGDDYGASLFLSDTRGFSFTNKENLNLWMTKTLTLLVRRDAMQKFPNRSNFKYWRDVHMNYYLLKQGKGYCLPFISAVCNKHSGGIFSSLDSMHKMIINLKVWNELLKHNKDDEVLRCFYIDHHNSYRDYIRTKIQHNERTELLNDIYTLLYLDFQLGGFKSVWFSCKKILLSLKYLITAKVCL